MTKFVIIAIIGVGLVVTGCSNSNEEDTLVYRSGDYETAENMAVLDVSFTDPAWDGINVPEGQQCSTYGGDGASPELLVTNIPSGANALIISFSDRTYKPNDLGGHGIIGIWITDQAASITVPSIPGESSDMPEGMFIVSEFRSNRGSSGAYLAPCSGGNGNEYYATVQAVYVGQSEDEASRLLGEADIELGVY